MRRCAKARKLPDDELPSPKHDRTASSPRLGSVITRHSFLPSALTEAARSAKLSLDVLRLVTFGGLGIEADNRLTAPRVRAPRLALLAVLAVAGDRGMSREKLA